MQIFGRTAFLPEGIASTRALVQECIVLSYNNEDTRVAGAE